MLFHHRMQISANLRVADKLSKDKVGSSSHISSASLRLSLICLPPLYQPNPVNIVLRKQMVPHRPILMPFLSWKIRRLIRGPILENFFVRNLQSLQVS
jgi:hypothetical protein